MNRFLQAFAASVVCLCCFNVHGQLKLIYNETFINNSNSWPISTEAGYTNALKEGHYNMHVKDASSHWVYIPTSINPAKYLYLKYGLKQALFQLILLPELYGM
ncbi:MAG: hypothetical protein ACHQF2_01695 [Flavobacteriales bacterium]